MKIMPPTAVPMARRPSSSKSNDGASRANTETTPFAPSAEHARATSRATHPQLDAARRCSANDYPDAGPPGPRRTKAHASWSGGTVLVCRRRPRCPAVTSTRSAAPRRVRGPPFLTSPRGATPRTRRRPAPRPRRRCPCRPRSRRPRGGPPGCSRGRRT